MTQLLTQAQATLLDKLLESETADYVMFIRYERDYLTQYPELFGIEPIDLMRALSTGYVAYMSPVEKWRNRQRIARENAVFLRDIGEQGAANEKYIEAQLIAEIDEDFGLGIIEKEAE